MSTKTLSVTFFAAFAAVGCSSGSASDGLSSSADQDLSGSEPSAPIGHYVLGAAGSGDDADWLNEINLHEHGTFDGNFGSSVSNLSGHFFLANGTYEVDQTLEGPALRFSYSLGGQSGAAQYLFKTSATGLDLKPTDEATEPWFSMDAAPAPVTLEFAGDGSVSAAGTLHAGDTALVRYAASRSKCGGSNATVTLLGEVDFPQPQFVDSVDEVDGYYDFLVPVSEGKQLALWFQQSNSSGCSAWDSNASKNYNFAIE